MTSHLESAATQIRKIAMEFLEDHVEKQFRRKELEAYIEGKFTSTEGARTGAINRLLKDNEKEGIFQVDRGLYLYDPTAKKEDYEVLKQIQKIMDDAFEEIKDTINKLKVVDYLTERDLSSIAKIHELLKTQKKIDEILAVKGKDK
ncbi:hypothetical protein COK91_02880 [Bacillus cereus]|uniref:hypothetical protein n=1 Tax=Bacillus cereus TaxID=1396 RepID=UPI000BF3AFC6|nr:hypothetical protein [Bacillus cereus]PFU84606.1 hypothetical protein COK91_02880 [Bacillus cereus]